MPLDNRPHVRECIADERMYKLYFYPASNILKSSAVRPEPLLIVYALVNRPEVLDLFPSRSFIHSLTNLGRDVYLIDWGYPSLSDKHFSFEDYVLSGVKSAVDTIRNQVGVNSLDLLGICQGGVMAACYSALFPRTVDNLVLMVTPIDFHTPDNMLSLQVKYLCVDNIVNKMGNVPGKWLTQMFVHLRPFDLGVRKYLDFCLDESSMESRADFLRMEAWIQDAPDLAGAAFLQFVKWFYQENRLIRGCLSLGGCEVKLSNLCMPIMNVIALRDHIIPPSASKCLGRYLNHDNYIEYEVDTGQIGLYVSKRSYRSVPERIVKWLAGLKETEGEKNEYECI